MPLRRSGLAPSVLVAVITIKVVALAPLYPHTMQFKPDKTHEVHKDLTRNKLPNYKFNELYKSDMFLNI